MIKRSEVLSFVSDMINVSVGGEDYLIDSPYAGMKSAEMYFENDIFINWNTDDFGILRFEPIGMRYRLSNDSRTSLTMQAGTKYVIKDGWIYVNQCSLTSF